MKSNLVYYILFILLGTISFDLGLTWKKPTYRGSVVHKYGALILGVGIILYGIISPLSALF